MATILSFVAPPKRPASRQRAQPGEVVIFPGVRYERGGQGARPAGTPTAGKTPPKRRRQ